MVSIMRIDIHDYFINIVKEVAKRATCKRRSVGCVLVNVRGHIIATGFNGVASGMPHCNESVMAPVLGSRKFPEELVAIYPNTCAGADAPSGTNLDACEAIHAEANALLQCKDVFEIDTAYVTAQPCIHCTKLLMNTGCKNIIYIEDYPHSSSKELWERSGRRMFKYVNNLKTDE